MIFFAPNILLTFYMQYTLEIVIGLSFILA